MRKFFIMLSMLTLTMAANAQFESGKTYVSASLSGIDFSYNGTNEASFSGDVNGGYFIDDCWLAKGQLGYQKMGKDVKGTFNVGAGIRYYVLQNGLFFGAGAKAQFSSGYNDVMPNIEAGYSFFINDKVTIEPALYYDQSLKNHSDYSTVGIRIGLGLYL